MTAGRSSITLLVRRARSRSSVVRGGGRSTTIGDPETATPAASPAAAVLAPPTPAAAPFEGLTEVAARGRRRPLPAGRRRRRRRASGSQGLRERRRPRARTTACCSCSTAPTDGRVHDVGRCRSRSTSAFYDADGTPVSPRQHGAVPDAPRPSAPRTAPTGPYRVRARDRAGGLPLGALRAARHRGARLRLDSVTPRGVASAVDRSRPEIDC